METSQQQTDNPNINTKSESKYYTLREAYNELLIFRIFRWFFGFQSYWLWTLGKFIHAILQIIIMFIVLFGKIDDIPFLGLIFSNSSYSGPSFSTRFLMEIVIFIIIRIVFELFLVVLSMNDSLGKIRDSLIKNPQN